uniref:Uncharacterized protein TCIL3000_11_11890 n=1 Tax=Trypanosoma congolense (strain IL3000) TaxID=1068625 RepID=G0V225_TRYCI|nr:unnamed protein product [Trypanosoma congolense IL3000]
MCDHRLQDATRPTYDELVLQWIDNAKGLCKEDRLRVLQTTKDNLSAQANARAVETRARAQSLLMELEADVDPATRRERAVAVSTGTNASTIRECLSQSCMMAVRFGHRTVQRLANVENVAAALADHNSKAKGYWGVSGEPRTCLTPSSAGAGVFVWTRFATDYEGEVITFYDEHLFDDFEHVRCIQRTLVADNVLAEEDIRSVMFSNDP